jgi:drug/metabolite transporter (DMT)-like permease
MTNTPLVILLGIISTIQTHLAKALERQGIEVFEQIKAKLQKTGQPVEGGIKKPIIYTIGFILNQVVFIWAVIAQPYGPPALFTSMFGIGLVFLMAYAAAVMKEKITRLETWGAAVIIAGTLVIGAENIFRQDADRFTMNLNGMFVALVVWTALGLIFIFTTKRTRNLNHIGLAFGAFAGGLGGLDPFLKGVGQSHGGDPHIIPQNFVGMALFVASFVVGFLAFLVTQFGFAKKVRASMLIPAYNAAYVGLPVVLQFILLPNYAIYWTTILGVCLIIGGIILMQAFKLESFNHLKKSRGS